MRGGLWETGGHRGEDGGFGVEAGADDKRKTETREVGGVEALEFGEFGVGQAVEAGAGLFAVGFGGEGVLLSEAAGEIGVSADEGELAGGRGGAHRGAKLRVEVHRVAKRSARPRLVGHPRRMLKEMTERGGEGRAIKSVE